MIRNDNEWIDVGGGAVYNHIDNRLANIPLRWMIQQCFETDTGIRFDVKRLRSIGLELKPDDIEGIVAASKAVSVSANREEDEKDALSEIHDELSGWVWWPLEFIPSWRWNKPWELKYVYTIQKLFPSGPLTHVFPIPA